MLSDRAYLLMILNERRHRRVAVGRCEVVSGNGVLSGDSRLYSDSFFGNKIRHNPELWRDYNPRKDK